MKIIDTIYRCKVSGQLLGAWELQCHLYVYQSHPEQQTIIVSNLRSETGHFVSFAMERLIEHIIIEFKLDPTTAVWLEHFMDYYNRPRTVVFSHITFKWTKKRISKLKRKPIDYDYAEALVGESLESGLLLAECER